MIGEIVNPKQKRGSNMVYRQTLKPHKEPVPADSTATIAILLFIGFLGFVMYMAVL